MKHRGSFKPGNKFFAKRKNNRGGRPKNAEVKRRQAREEIERLAGELAKKEIEQFLGSAIKAYGAMATGLKVGKVKRKFDPATCRHVVERFVPPATKTVHVVGDHSAEDFYEEVMNEGEGEPRQIEDKTDEVPPKEEQH